MLHFIATSSFCTKCTRRGDKYPHGIGMAGDRRIYDQRAGCSRREQAGGQVVRFCGQTFDLLCRLISSFAPHYQIFERI